MPPEIKENNSLLGPTLRGLYYWGMWQGNRNQTWRFTFNAIHVAAIIFVITQYIELWILRADINKSIRNLSITMLSSVCVVKASTFVIYQERWKEIVNFVSSMEKAQKTCDSEITSIVKENLKYCRRITYFYWSLVTATVFIVVLAPLIGYISSAEYRESIKNGTEPYPEIMSSWLPFNKSRGFGYLIMIIEQTLICIYGGGIVANYDANALVIMSFFAGQFEILKLNSSRIFDGKGYEEAMARIAKCHEHHNSVIKY